MDISRRAITLTACAIAAALTSPIVNAQTQSPPAGSVGGMGDVNIYPKRVVIDDRHRIASLGLYNRSASPGEYEITVSDKLMRPDGSLVELDSVTDPAERARVRSVANLVKWSPRRVSLAGNEAQTVRIMAHVPPDLPPGEYRSHFAVVSNPAAAEAQTLDEATSGNQPSGIGVRIIPRFGISIPVILRVGETTLNVTLADIALVETPRGKAVRLTIRRDGTRSAFGDIAVTVPRAKGPVAEVMGIGVYTEVGARTVEIPITPGIDPRLLAPGTRLTVTYTDDDAAPGKVLARSDFVLP